MMLSSSLSSAGAPQFASTSQQDEQILIFHIDWLRIHMQAEQHLNHIKLTLPLHRWYYCNPGWGGQNGVED